MGGALKAWWLFLMQYGVEYFAKSLSFMGGDVEIARRISSLLTPRLIPGHISYGVDVSEAGIWILTVDAADLAQDLFDPVEIGGTATMEDAAKVGHSIQKLIDAASRLDVRYCLFKI